jgi:hypothetical protein
MRIVRDSQPPPSARVWPDLTLRALLVAASTGPCAFRLLERLVRERGELDLY